MWGACPSELHHHCISRYGYPILRFYFVCSQNRGIQYISRAFYGAINDITIITYNDNYPTRLILCQVHIHRSDFSDFQSSRRCYILEGGRVGVGMFLLTGLSNLFVIVS